MTIKELYEWAKKNHCENAVIVVNYNCGDSWYDIPNQEITIKNLDLSPTFLWIDMS